MKNATITPDKQQGDPAAVTEKDLKLEIGEWVVASIQKAKVIQQLALYIQRLTATIAEQKKQVGTVPAIERSNRLFDEKNRKLADAIQDVRAERDKAVAGAALASTNEAKAVEALTTCQQERDRLQGLYDGSEKERKAVNDLIDEANATIEEQTARLLKYEKTSPKKRKATPRHKKA